MVKIETRPAVPTFTLAHPTFGVQYDFRVLSETEVEVAHTVQRGRHVYQLPISEARQLWHKLINKGYERF